MSLRELQETARGLPPNLQEQVIGYARSVRDALPDIFREAGSPHDAKIADQVIFLAGVRKIHSLVASAYWTVDNSGKLLESMGEIIIRAGSLDLTRQGAFHSRLQSLIKQLENVLRENKIDQLPNINYAELIRLLSKK